MAQVPLADDRGLVARRLEQLGERSPLSPTPTLEPSVVTPLMWVWVPVRMEARLGAQIELVQKQLSRRIPPAARRSIWGVALIRLP